MKVAATKRRRLQPAPAARDGQTADAVGLPVRGVGRGRRPPEGRPFLKWAGGKQRLIAQIEPHVPVQFRRYHEPFMGSAALFFHLASERPGRLPARLSDTNERLVRTFVAIRDRVEAVIALLAGYPHERTFFEVLRGCDIDGCTDVEVAAWLLYLNRTGYNGLYRVNSKNRFNVPFGDYARPTICDPVLLRSCSRALRAVRIELEDFERAVSRSVKGDFVYFDPPYVPLSSSSNFTAYTQDGFDLDAHERLRDLVRSLKARGVHVLVSNSAAPEVVRLYGNGFERLPVSVRRAVNCKADGRGLIEELLIR